MPSDNENLHVKATPHFDEKKEDIINDPTASAGSKMGIQVDTKAEFGSERNPFNHMPKQDQGMKKLGKLVGGHKIEDKGK
ncbi:hypothetical protein JMM81_07585 [Bacillus sp. V3B]|uniref:hypothetical protein n=1 Tax=Bacillus sp. V3B TaxID=2804915 RepID=UPI0021097AE3|nr:hypothetical protein [Bacillus sp. V3B]MCQ6274831.1 hypothetical protein [Bacillus sp. V3B]